MDRKWGRYPFNELTCEETGETGLRRLLSLHRHGGHGGKPRCGGLAMLANRAWGCRQSLEPVPVLESPRGHSAGCG